MNSVPVLPKGRFGEMISFEFHLKNRHEKTREPLWFPGFQPRYLFRCCLLYRAAEKDIAFEPGRHRRTPTVFWFRRTAPPALSTAEAVLALYFFNFQLISYVLTIPFQKPVLCYNSIGSRRRLTISVYRRYSYGNDYRCKHKTFAFSQKYYARATLCCNERHVRRGKQVGARSFP